MTLDDVRRMSLRQMTDRFVAGVQELAGRMSVTREEMQQELGKLTQRFEELREENRRHQDLLDAFTYDHAASVDAMAEKLEALQGDVEWLKGKVSGKERRGWFR